MAETSGYIKSFKEYFLHKNGIIKKEFGRWYTYSSLEIPYNYNASIIDAYNLCWFDNYEKYSLWPLDEEKRKYNISVIENAIKNNEISFVPGSFRKIYMEDENRLSIYGEIEAKIICQINLLNKKKIRNLFLIIALEDFKKMESIDDGEKLIIEIGE